MFWKKSNRESVSNSKALGRYAVQGSNSASPVGQLSSHLAANQDLTPKDESGVLGTVEAKAPASSADREAARYVIPAGYRIESDFFVPGTVRVEGELTGRGLIAHRVVVSAGGTIGAPVTTRDISVAGLVTSPIRAKERVEVFPGGRVSDVESPSLHVQAGGSISAAQLRIGVAR